ncbi:1,4-dihydroxy-2-naphthoate octaprenyltransferase [bacterium]|nr:1,4-dihydroxy-2-naphthoate octaprenyltransferase [bacterium]
MLSAWIAAFRLKTLPLALGAILIGSWLPPMSFDVKIFGLAALTAILLQVLSNLANDYGDFVKGTDKHRKDRQLAGGKIKPEAMKNAIFICATLAFLSGCYLLYSAFGTQLKYWLVFLGIGIACILAAILYTVGKKAYGYYGLGDLFVFIFFGLVGVTGTAFLFEQEFHAVYFFSATAYGMMCVAVLNVNNIRDLEKDVLNNKITLASKLGKEGAGSYQALLLLTAVVCLLADHFIRAYTTLAPIGLIALTYFHLIRLNKCESPEDYNQQLKFLSLGSLGVALLFIFRLYL